MKPSNSPRKSATSTAPFAFEYVPPSVFASPESFFQPSLALSQLVASVETPSFSRVGASDGPHAAAASPSWAIMNRLGTDRLRCLTIFKLPVVNPPAVGFAHIVPIEIHRDNAAHARRAFRRPLDSPIPRL